MLRTAGPGKRIPQNGCQQTARSPLAEQANRVELVTEVGKPNKSGNGNFFLSFPYTLTTNSVQITHHVFWDDIKIMSLIGNRK